MPSQERRLRAKGVAPSSLFTPLRRKVIVGSIAAGNHYPTAAAAAGISYECLQEWLELGRKGKAPYAEFSRECEQAEAEAEQLALSIIQRHAQGFVKKTKRVTTGDDGESTVEEETEESDWRAAAYLLDRRFSTRWALARKLQFSGTLDMRQHVIIHTNPEDAKRIIEVEEGVLLVEEADGTRRQLHEGPEDEEGGGDGAAGQGSGHPADLDA